MLIAHLTAISTEEASSSDSEAAAESVNSLIMSRTATDSLEANANAAVRVACLIVVYYLFRSSHCIATLSYITRFPLTLLQRIHLIQEDRVSQNADQQVISRVITNSHFVHLSSELMANPLFV